MGLEPSVLLSVFAAATAGWLWLGRWSPVYLLPAYIVLSIIPAPFADLVLVYPNLGFGELERPLPSVGDVLLVATVLLSGAVRRQVTRRLPMALILVSVVGIAVGLVAAEYPASTVFYLGLAPLRVGLLIALLGAAPPNHSRHRLGATLAALGLFLVPVAAGLVNLVYPGMGPSLEKFGLLAGGRISFPTLGNNKIGICLLVLIAALLIAAGRPGEASARRHLPWAIALAVIISAAASLRFATTALLLVMLLFAMRESEKLAVPGILVAALGFVWVVLATQGGQAPIRALGVVSGTFEVGGDSSASSRLELNKMALALWRDHPLIGRVGQWEFDREATRLVFLTPIETHSEFTWQLVTFGLLGFAVVAAALARAVRAGRNAGSVALAATGLTVLSMALNSVTFFPVAAACLAMLVDAGTRRLQAGVGEASPAVAVGPDHLPERTVGVEGSTLSTRG